jgi:hypothetical protein
MRFRVAFILHAFDDGLNDLTKANGGPSPAGSSAVEGTVS